MTDTLTNGGGGLSSAKQHEEEVKARVLKQYGVDSVDKLPVSWAGISLQAGEDHGNAVFDKLYGELWDTFEQQNSLQRWTGIAAPLLALRPVSMAFSGTDFAQHRHFATAAEEYRRLLNRKMNDEIRDHAAGKDYAHIVGDEFWQEIPPFVYEAPSTGWVLQQQAASLGLLGAWAFGAAALCAAAARRLRVD
jgi:ABC-2 type transport system permease protein